MASAGSSQERLNIMPMLDVFSILITFLLMSYSTEPVSHDLSEDMELPSSITIKSLDEIPTIIVSKKEIFVGDNKVSEIDSGDVIAEHMEQGAIYPLYEELQKLADANKRYKEERGVDEEDPENKKTTYLTMEMDKGHNFKLMKRIMLSAQQAEFIAFKLMVSKEMN